MGFCTCSKRTSFTLYRILLVQYFFLPISANHIQISSFSTLLKFVRVWLPLKAPVDKIVGTALHLAAGNGYFNICKMIYEESEDKNPTNTFGDTPLHIAAYHGQLKICKYLIENGMDKSLQNKLTQTPFDLAKCNGHFSVCILLRSSFFFERIISK